VKGNGGGINPAEFVDNWVSTCCAGYMCRLGSGVGVWNCSSSAPHLAGPADQVLIRGSQKLPPSLAVSRTTVKGLSGAYKPSLVEIDSGTILMGYRSMPHKLLTFQRSSNSGATWSAPETRADITGDEEWSLHALKGGVVLLADGSGRMFRSIDGAVTFNNCSGEPTEPAGHPFKFNCTDECGSWSVFEVSSLDEHLSPLPLGVYYFTDRAMWQSTNEGQNWRPFSRASSASGHMPRDGQWGHDEFFSQSEVYRRRDGTFLHSARMNTEMCDGWYETLDSVCNPL
jgi:hypothetical protein